MVICIHMSDATSDSKESEALRLFQQIVTIVNDCHENGICLRDLKLRKFVFTDPEK